jgi:DNA-binding transcriptional LysR family regulator
MDAQHVRYFLAICEERNFTRAAKRCGIAQPSLTVAIQRLEREIGGVLFLRSTHAPHVQLTTLGMELYPICIQLNKLFEDTRTIVGSQ